MKKSKRVAAAMTAAMMMIIGLATSLTAFGIDETISGQTATKQYAEEVVTYTQYVQDDLNLRKGPGTEYAVKTVLKKCTKLTVYGQDRVGQWVKVETESGMKGYVNEKWLADKKPAIKITRYATVNGLRIHSKPTVDSKTITKVKKGGKITCYRNRSSVKGWFRCKVNGEWGYVSIKYLSKNAPKEFLGYYQLTAYGATGNRTASGTWPCEGRTVAMNGVKLGTKVYIEGYGTYVVEDTGGMGYGVVDVYMEGGEGQRGINFGRKYNVPVYIINN